MVSELPPCPVFLFALEREHHSFLRQVVAQPLTNSPARAWACGLGTASFVVVETGVGERTRACLDWLAPFQPPYLVFAGFAGALTAELPVGALLWASKVVDEAGHSWKSPMPTPTGLRPGRLLTTSHLVGEPELKRSLGAQHHAEAVDMESAVFARFCSERGWRWGCLRAISDDVDARLDPALVTLLSGGQVSIPRVLGALCRRPMLLPSLLRLGNHTKIAAKSLARALTELVGASEGERGASAP